ncbi:hypothetical protein Nepgr_028874 [Nepenthes gracilis]|uniref:Uncharacterized protein n=1 Tax=Nepenthes gracilis TaxID=150966 RepID=A0AAD3Y501_NEPGR|nr:hypothetical protein Nepgr_028874 [Nepenthes gracilis]
MKTEAVQANQEDCLPCSIFGAAVTALFMACLLGQWRAHVFLLLNVVLLAILVTSVYCTSRKIKREETERKPKKPGRLECDNYSNAYDIGDRSGELVRKRSDWVEQVEGEAVELSKEELNLRAEAFIAMFKQHLVSDAKKGRIVFSSSVVQSLE